jgi:plastocyanin
MRTITIGGLVAALLLAGTAGAAAADASVSIENFTFNPPSLVVAPGTEVTWTNLDDVPHIVREDSGSFASTALDTDERFSRPFDAPGTYRYYCVLHPHMQGVIIVQPLG